MTGIERIAAERRRQIEEEGFTAERDATNTDGQLAQAAAYYCVTSPQEDHQEDACFNVESNWPVSWHSDGMKRTEMYQPSDRDLEKAGALIAAELDRRADIAAKDGE